jgi:tricarballylate dehydrogenase
VADLCDVLIVGGGNAGLCAAHAALETTSRVLLIDKAPEQWAGGNSYFAQGSFRTVVNSLDDLLQHVLSEEVDEARLGKTVYPPYTKDDFLADMKNATAGRCDPELTEVLVGDSLDTISWLASKGLEWELAFDRRAFHIEGQWKFWGGGAVSTRDRGRGLIDQHMGALKTAGLDIRFDTGLLDIALDNSGRVSGAICQTPDGVEVIGCRSIVLACGGFAASPRLRAAYLGPGWDWAAVRGTPYNTGDGLKAAFKLGAQDYGNWSGCHSVAWDADAIPTSGDRVLGSKLTRSSYQYGIVVNQRAKRFIDEGADLRTLTYAKYGAEILKQPDHKAYQIFDSQTRELLTVEYNYAVDGPATGTTIAELAARIGIDPDALVETVDQFNASTSADDFDPSIKDGKSTQGIDPPKSNWAVPLTTPPFYAFPVTCGITFTYGGLRITPDAHVLNRQNRPIAGLFACGEMVGGLFYGNYPAGAGLTAGAVFGRRAGRSAAEFAGQRPHAANSRNGGETFH